MDKGNKEGYEAESKGFGELAMTPQSKGLISLFRGQTECKKNRFGAPLRKVEKVWLLFVLSSILNQNFQSISVNLCNF